MEGIQTRTLEMPIRTVMPAPAPRELLPAPKSAAEAMALAKTLSSSKMIPQNFQGKPEDVFVTMLWSHTLGIPVVQGLQYIAVINGKPSMYGDGMLAVVMNSGKLKDIEEKVESTKEGLVATCTVWRVNRQTPTVSIFTQKDAERAGLWTKSGPWKLYPKRMLKMRARAFALRDAFPDVLAGMASSEEQQDIIEVQAEVVQPKPRMPRRKASAEKAEEAKPVAAAEAPSAEVGQIDPADQPDAGAPQEEPAPVQIPPVEAQQTAEERDLNNATDLATVEDWISAGNYATSYGELVELYKIIPPEMQREHPEIAEHYAKLRDKLNGVQE